MNTENTTTETPEVEAAQVTTDAETVAEVEAPEVETTDDTDGEDTDRSRAGRDAARYRRELREVEAERDALRGQITAARDALLAEALAGKFNIACQPRTGHASRWRGMPRTCRCRTLGA